MITVEVSLIKKIINVFYVLGHEGLFHAVCSFSLLSCPGKKRAITESE